MTTPTLREQVSFYINAYVGAVREGAGRDNPEELRDSIVDLCEAQKAEAVAEFWNQVEQAGKKDVKAQSPMSEEYPYQTLKVMQDKARELLATYQGKEEGV